MKPQYPQGQTGLVILAADAIVPLAHVASTSPDFLVRGDPFITFAERGRGVGYPKANVVSEVA